MNANKRRSPLRDRALRNPGESVEAARRRLQIDVMGVPLAITCGALAAATIEVIGFAFNVPRAPFLYSALLAIAIGYLVCPGGGFNIDHVLIGPAGVITVETKAWSKPVGGEPKIAFDGETLSGRGHATRTRSNQAVARPGFVDQDLLKESTGRDFPVRGAVLFPGWYVEQGEGTVREIWVLNPKALPAFLSNSKQVLSPEDVKLGAFHLSRYVFGSHQRSWGAKSLHAEVPWAFRMSSGRGNPTTFHRGSKIALTASLAIRYKTFQKSN